MKKKRSSRSIGNGFSAYTVEGRRGFNPVYSEGPRHGSRLFLLKGLHTVVEAYMLDNPGKRLPSKQLATRFRTSTNVIRSIAKRVERKHKLPKRGPGGAPDSSPRLDGKIRPRRTIIPEF